MDDEGFYFHMRMSKEIFAKLLEKVQHHYQERNATSSHTGGRTKIPLIDALSMTIWYLASKTTFRELGNLFGHHRTVLNRKFHQMVNLINEDLEDVVKWPTSSDNLDARFRQLVGFPGVVGSIDGFDVHVIAPANEQASYNSRKQVHRIKTIAVTNHQMKFIYAFVGVPGSLHDQRALNNCSLGRDIKHSPNQYFESRNYHLVGDSAFTLQLNL